MSPRSQIAGDSYLFVAGRDGRHALDADDLDRRAGKGRGSAQSVTASNSSTSLTMRSMSHGRERDQEAALISSRFSPRSPAASSAPAWPKLDRTEIRNVAPRPRALSPDSLAHPWACASKADLMVRAASIAGSPLRSAASRIISRAKPSPYPALFVELPKSPSAR